MHLRPALRVARSPNNPRWHIKLTVFKSRPYFHRPWSMVLSHARKGGGPVPKTETSWRNINGVGIFLPTRSIWLEFRRTY
jgi:hypothetical protein